LEDLERFGVSEEQIATRHFTPAFAELMRFEVGRAREIFRCGLPLAGKVDRRLGLDLELFSRGGMEVLNLIERQGYDVLSRRPALSRRRKAALIARRLMAPLIGRRAAA